MRAFGHQLGSPLAPQLQALRLQVALYAERRSLATRRRTLSWLCGEVACGVGNPSIKGIIRWHDSCASDVSTEKSTTDLYEFTVDSTARPLARSVSHARHCRAGATGRCRLAGARGYHPGRIAGATERRRLPGDSTGGQCGFAARGAGPDEERGVPVPGDLPGRAKVARNRGGGDARRCLSCA